MKEITKNNEKFMTVKEVSEILKKDESTIRKIGKNLFPDCFKNGVKTYLNEKQITVIKLNLGKNSELPKTDLEKEMIIQQALILQQEKIKALKKENEEKENHIKKLIHSGKLYTSSEIAKELNLRSAAELNLILKEKGMQYKVNGTWVLSANYSEKGYVSIKQDELENGRIVYYRKWTGIGRDFILSLFEA